MTAFDYIFLGVLGFSALIGLWRGLASEVISLLAWALALLATWRYGSDTAALLAGIVAEPAWRYVASFVLIFVAVLLLAALLRFLLRELLKAAGLGTADHFFGAIYGLARGLAIVFSAVLLGGMVGVAREPWWANAKFAPPMEVAVISVKPWLPDVVADRIRFK